MLITIKLIPDNTHNMVGSRASYSTELNFKILLRLIYGKKKKNLSHILPRNNNTCNNDRNFGASYNNTAASQLIIAAIRKNLK